MKKVTKEGGPFLVTLSFAGDTCPDVFLVSRALTNDEVLDIEARAAVFKKDNPDYEVNDLVEAALGPLYGICTMCDMTYVEC